MLGSVNEPSHLLLRVEHSHSCHWKLKETFKHTTLWHLHQCPRSSQPVPHSPTCSLNTQTWRRFGTDATPRCPSRWRQCVSLVSLDTSLLCVERSRGGVPGKSYACMIYHVNLMVCLYWSESESDVASDEFIENPIYCLHWAATLKGTFSIYRKVT